MSLVLTLALRELRSFFRVPTGWIVVEGRLQAGTCTPSLPHLATFGRDPYCRCRR